MKCGVYCTKCGQGCGHIVKDYTKKPPKRDKYAGRFVPKDLKEIIVTCFECGTGEKISIISGKITAIEPYLPFFVEV